MPVSIIANSSAQLAQSAIRERSEALTAGANRLSSGQRVISAGDDAAALSVGTSLRITNSGLSTAILNTSSAVSTLQIAEGSMSEITNLIIRMQALATQASSGQLDNPTRTLIDAEFQNLKTEVNRLAQATEFNGVRLLAGARNFTTTTANGLAAQGVASVRYDPQLVTGDRTLRVGYDATTETLTVTRLDTTPSTAQSIDITALLDAVAGAGQNLAAGTALEVGFGTLGVTLTLNNAFDRAASQTPANTLTPGPDVVVDTPVFTPATTNMPQSVAAALAALTSGYDAATGTQTFALESDGTNLRFGAVPGLAFRVNGGAIGAVGAPSANLNNAGPNTVEILVEQQAPFTGLVNVGSYQTGALTISGPTDGTLELGLGSGLVGAEFVDTNAPTRLVYKVGTGVAAGQDLLAVEIPAMTTAALGIDTLNITNTLNADAAILGLADALSTVNLGRATVGAQQLRLEQIGVNLGVVTLNNEAARSALLDADVAKEISDYTANQALMEAGVAMLGRANQLPGVLLDLLRNG